MHWAGQAAICRLEIALLVLLLTKPGSAGDYLAELTWVEARAAFAERAVVVLPFAAGAKEHALHLPLNTDEQVLEFLLNAAVEERDVLVVPPVLHGWFPAFRSFPGTEVADPAVFQNYIRSVAESIIRNGARRLVLLNMGIARATGLPLGVVARELRAQYGVPVLLVNWDDLETDEVASFTEQERGGHADEIETSIMLALNPDAVHMDRARKDYRGERKPLIGYAPGKFSTDETGGYGDPTLASAAKGRKALAIMRRQWLDALSRFAKVPIEHSAHRRSQTDER